MNKLVVCETCGLLQQVERAPQRAHTVTLVAWDEIETALKKESETLLTFEPDDVLKRIQKRGDLFAPVLKLKQKLPSPDILHYETR